MNSLDQLLAELLGSKEPSAPRPSPWRAEYISIHTTTQHCTSCGHSSTFTSSEPLVTFTNTRTATLWHVANHPSVANSSLPRRILCAHESISTCHRCFNWSGEPTKQLPLQLEPQAISSSALNAQFADARQGASI